VKVLFGTNVVLDVLLDREPYAVVAAKLLACVDRGVLAGVICATTVTTIHYIASKSAGPGSAKRHLRDLLAMFDIASVDRGVLDRALELDFEDFEDAVLHEAARAAGAAAIVTRNAKDFGNAVIPVLDPEELLAAVLASSES
jgi:predicted nucleic acid-binding protein